MTQIQTTTSLMFKLAWNQSVRMISEMNSLLSLWEQEARGQDSWESTLNWLQSEAWKQPVADKRCQYCRDCREIPTGHSKNCPNCPFVPTLCQTLHRDCHKMYHLPSLNEKQTQWFARQTKAITWSLLLKVITSGLQDQDYIHVYCILG